MTKHSAGGGKLNRTETVTVRLDPKLNYLCELAARAQRRSRSSFIEWAVQRAITGDPDFGERDQLWDIDPDRRLTLLAEKAPHLMTYDEQVEWARRTRGGDE